MAREPFPAEYTQDSFQMKRVASSSHRISASKTLHWMSEIVLKEKLDEILDYLRRVGSSGKRVEARKLFQFRYCNVTVVLISCLIRDPHLLDVEGRLDTRHPSIFSHTDISISTWRSPSF